MIPQVKKNDFVVSFIVLLWAFPALSQVTASWDESEGATGYNFFWGTSSRVYTENVTVYDTEIQIPLLRFERERTYFFTVTAFNDYGESGFGDEVPFFIPTGVEEAVLDFKDCDEVKIFNILLQRVKFDRARLPTGSYFHVCYRGDKILWVKREGLLK